jgi:hypothetical protein
MKNLSLFIVLLLALVSCHQHTDEGTDATYTVAIKINAPVKDAVFSIEQYYNIDIMFERPNNALIHNVDIAILDATTSKVVTVLKQGHVHTKSPYQFEENNFRVTQKGKYIIRATTTDDSGQQPNELQQAFTVN